MGHMSSILSADPPSGGSFDIYVSEGFVLTELALIVDPLRIANRISQRPLFRWRYLSQSGGVIRSSSDAMIDTEQASDRPETSYLFVIGAQNSGASGGALRKTISTYVTRNIRVCLLAEAASWYIRDHGGGGAHTTHWENRVYLEEEIDASACKASLASDDGRIITSAGMSATADLVMSLMRAHVSAATVQTVADIMLHEKVRDLNTPQPFGAHLSAGTGDAKVNDSISLMQANVQEPLQIAHICRLIGLSERSLERRFRAQLGSTPNGYYRELRLNKATNLLLNTRMSVGEIGLTCGFSNGFASPYKSLFGVTPSQARMRKNTAYQGMRPKAQMQ